jgi:hypothetical protein
MNTEQNYTLIPITIDKLGRLGYTAHEFLGMQKSIVTPNKAQLTKASKCQQHTNLHSKPSP